MYPSRDGNHLSLYLNMKNDLSKDTSTLVQLTLSIKDQETGNHLEGTGTETCSTDRVQMTFTIAYS